MAPDEEREPRAAGVHGIAPHQIDLDLAEAARGESEPALRALAARLACVPRYVAAWNRRDRLGLDDAELADVSQEILILAWRKLPTFDGRASLETWAFALALGQLRNAVRGKRRRVQRFAGGPSDEVAAPEPQAAELSAEDSDFVRRAVEDLPDGESEVVRLKHFEGLTFEDLAHTLQISPNTAKSRYYRALVRLAGVLRRWKEA